jgi:hypothetical protein
MQLQDEYQLRTYHDGDYETDDCNMCGDSGCLDLEQAQECPDCQGFGRG